MDQDDVLAQRPVTVLVAGIEVTDPFLHLEEDDDAVLAWQRRESESTGELLRRWPGFEQLVSAVARERVDASPRVPVRAGGRLFDVVDGALVVVEDGRTRVLLRPSRVDATSIDWWYPSPQGARVAVGVSTGGDEQSVLRIVETASGEVLADALPHCSHAGVAWLPDERSFYVNAGSAPDQVDATKRMHHYVVGDGALGPAEDLPAPLGVVSRPQVSPDGRYALLMSYPAVLTWRASWVLDREGREGWREMVPPGVEQLDGHFEGDRYVAVTRDGAPRGRLVSIPVATGGDPSTWRELVPEGVRVLLEVLACDDRLVLHELDHAASRLRVVTRAGAPLLDVPLPPAGTVSGLRVDGPGSVAFSWQGFTASASEWILDVGSGVVREVRPARRTLDGVETLPLTARSADGTAVPAHLVRRVDLGDGPRPCVIHAYGGFNARFTPEYIGAFAPFVRAGGVYVRAYVRGGGEFGSDWWHAGRMATKQHTFDDVHALAENLCQQGITTPELLGVTGSSNGGLLAGVVAVQRPDLYRACVPVVPVLDLARGARDPFMAASMRLEYGDPDDPEQMAWMLGYSPYHNVVDGTAYPAVLVAGGANDIRTPIWHSRKYVARLRQASTSGLPVLLRAWESVGHGTGTTADNADLVAAEPVAFLMKELGLSAPPPGEG